MEALIPRETGKVWQVMDASCQALRRNTISISGPRPELPVVNPINAFAKSKHVPYVRSAIILSVVTVPRVRLVRKVTSAKTKALIRVVPLASTMGTICRHQRAHASRAPKVSIVLRLVVRVKVFVKSVRKATFVLHQ